MTGGIPALTLWGVTLPPVLMVAAQRRSPRDLICSVTSSGTRGRNLA